MRDMKNKVFFLTICFIFPVIIKAQVCREISGTTVTFSGHGTIVHSDVPHGVERVIIKEGITTIGYCAFDYCCNLTSVDIPKSVTSLAERAFYHCCKLTSINIPSTVTSIGKNAFGDCSSLTNVNISVESSIGEEAFRHCSNLTSVNILGSVTTIGERAFKDCGKLTTISMPNSILSIGEEAFRNCCSLTSITIPNSCTSIEWFAFADCSSLKSIIIPNSVTSIGSNTFEGCSSLKSISIPNSVTSIGSNAFYKCSNLLSIHSIPTFVFQDYKWIYLGIPQEAIYAYLLEHKNEDHIRQFAQGIDDKINKIEKEKRIKAKGGYADVNEISNGGKKYWKVSKGGRYGLTDEEGKVIVPTEMEVLESAGTGYLRYKLNGFWGLMDYTGRIIIDTDRGYTSIGDFKTFNKRFPYTMTGYKGECDINGRQISKIKVETPQQTSSSSTSSSMGLTTQQNNGIYPFEYSESNSNYECKMKKDEFSSIVSSESFRININQMKNGNNYIVELYLNSLVTGSAVAKWSNVSPKTTSDGDLCTISMTLSNGETLRIERCMMVDHRRKDLQDTDRIGAIAIMFSPLYAYPSDNNQSSNEREQFVINQLSKYDIKSISYIGSTFSFESAKTAATINAMLKSISDHR